MRSDDILYQYDLLEKIKRPTANDIGKRYNIEGHVSEVTHKKYMIMGIFECKRCGTMNKQPQYSSFIEAVSSGYKNIKPFMCDIEKYGCGRSGATNFKIVLPECNYTTYEEVKLIPIDSRYRPRFILEGENVGVVEEEDEVKLHFILSAVPRKNKEFISRYFNIVKKVKIL